MKKIVIFTVVLLIFLQFGGVAVAGTLSNIGVIYGSMSVNGFSMEGSSSYGVKTSFYLLPPGASVRQIVVSEGPGANVKLNNVESGDYYMPHSSLFSTNSPHVFWEYGKMREYNFIKIYFYPFAKSSNGKWSLVHSVRFSIKYNVGQPKTPLSNETVFSSIAKEIFSNYRNAQVWYKPLLITPVSSDECDYLIIIPNSTVENALSNFISYKEKIDGYKVKVVTLNEIKSVESAKDTEDKIRDFLKEHYLKWGIKYVLLVGSSHSLPMCYMYPKKGETRDENGLERPIGRTPTDFYYSELDSNWDYNKDGLPGEFPDDTKHIVDFYPDVFVGRIPFDNPDKIQTVLDHNIEYEEAKETFRKSALLAGAMLYYGEEGGGRQDGGLALSFALQNYLKPAGFTTFSMFEKAGTHSSYFQCNEPLTEKNFVEAMRSQKYGLVLLNAHGSPNYIARKYWVDSDKHGKVNAGEIKWETLVSTSDINKYLFAPSVFYSASCETAWPEKDNIGKEILLHGGAAYIGASRISYGGGTIDPVLENFVKNYTLDNFSLGASLDIALFEEPHEQISDFVNLYDFNLYGDPSLRVNPVHFTGFSIAIKGNRSIKVKQGNSAAVNLVFKGEGLSKAKFGFVTDVDGISGSFSSSTNTSEIGFNVVCGNDTPPGDFVISIYADAGDGKVFSVPLHITVEKQSFSEFDLNEDGKVDGKDLIIFAESFGAKKGDTNYNAKCDFNGDGVIDGKDLMIFAKHFNNG